jgi:hypothetical protein
LQFNFVKIFDVCNLDDCFNRFRPVANAFHFLDALMIGYLNPGIAYHFKSISHLIFGLATALTFALTFKRLITAKDYGFALALGAFIIISIPWLAPNNIFFRPGKFIAAWLAAYGFYVWVRFTHLSVIQSQQTENRLAFWLAIILWSIFSLSDEQSSFVIALFFGLAFIELLFKPQKNAFFALMVLIAIIHGLALKFLAPWTYLHYASNQIDESTFSLARLMGINPHAISQVIAELFTTGTFNLQALLNGLHLHVNYDIALLALKAFINDFMVIFGDAAILSPIYIWGNAIIVIGFLLFGFIRSKNITFKGILIGVYFLFALYALQYAMGIAHQGSIGLHAEQIGYYCLPTVSLFYGLLVISYIKSSVLQSKLSQYIAIGLICFWSYSSWSIFQSRENYFSHSRTIAVASDGKIHDIDENIIVGRIVLGLQEPTPEILNGFTDAWASYANSFIRFYASHIAKKPQLPLDPKNSP